MLSNKHYLPGGEAAVQVAVRQVAVDPFRQQSGSTCHFAAQCNVPEFYAAWKCRERYVIYIQVPVRLYRVCRNLDGLCQILTNLSNYLIVILYNLYL